MWLLFIVHTPFLFERSGVAWQLFDFEFLGQLDRCLVISRRRVDVPSRRIVAEDVELDARHACRDELCFDQREGPRPTPRSRQLSSISML